VATQTTANVTELATQTTSDETSNCITKQAIEIKGNDGQGC
jgi:hypothetical protein